MAKKKGNNYIIDEKNGTAKIELRRRGKESLWTIIDLEDLQRVLDFPYTWFAKYDKDIDNYYACATEHISYDDGKITNKPVYLHQFILNAKGKIVDHKNHDTLDNTKWNIEIVKDRCNSTNRKSRNINNKSGYRNVSWDGYKWIVQLQVNGKNAVLGRFDKEKLEEAGKFAEQKRKEIYGDYSGNS